MADNELIYHQTQQSDVTFGTAFENNAKLVLISEDGKYTLTINKAKLVNLTVESCCFEDSAIWTLEIRGNAELKQCEDPDWSKAEHLIP